MSVVDLLKTAHQQLRKAVPGLRLKARKDEGKLAAAFREAMQIMDAQKAEGVPFTERVKGLDAVLRGVWPFTREWKYVCTQCDDYGLVIGECAGDATCGRHRLHLRHSFGTPCWCSLGERFKTHKPSADDFTAAGKSKPRPGPTRIGR